MKLYVFNPEHDIALAMNKDRFTAPHAGRQLRADLGFIPALWAEDGDLVLVDDVEAVKEAVRHLSRYVKKVTFVSPADLSKIDIASLADFEVESWGWDSSICRQLADANPALRQFLPDHGQIEVIRMMSGRNYAAEKLLPQLVGLDERLVGRSCYCRDLHSVVQVVAENGKSVLKSPWSSSGRGVRYVESDALTDHQQGWINNVISRQGGIMAEPFYRKVLDFGMEFMACRDGRIDFCGLSMFDTLNGAYTGSVLATEEDKRGMLSRYCSMELLDRLCKSIKSILSPLFVGRYHGPFGVDMMVVATDSADAFMVHPCVELNLRRTMGHAALAVSPSNLEPQCVMNISFSGKYHLRILKTNANTLKQGLV